MMFPDEHLTPSKFIQEWFVKFTSESFLLVSISTWAISPGIDLKLSLLQLAEER